MSPAIDMPLNRREAMTSLLAMLAFVMGLGGAIDEAEAETRSDSDHVSRLPRTDYALDGVFVAHDGDLEVNALVQIEDAKVSIQRAGSNKVRTIYAQRPAAIAFVDTLAAELTAIASTPEPFEIPPLPQLPPHTSTTWGAHFFGQNRVRYVSAWLDLATDDLNRVTIALRPAFGADGPPLWSHRLYSDASVELLSMLSELGDSQHEEALKNDRARAWEIWCPDCRGIGGTQSGCTTCHGNYSRIMTPEEAEERYQRDRADYAAKVAALP